MDQANRFDDVIRTLLRRKPFAPFAVTLTSGERIEVTREFQLSIGGGKTIAIMVKRPGGILINKSEIAAVDELEPAR